MSATAAIETRFPVGRRTCTLTLPAAPAAGSPLAMAVEWAPDVPRRLSAAELGQYRRGRDSAVAAWAERTGVRVALVEV
jgi:hypothetical protein